MRVLALAALAACSYPEKVPADGAGPPFGCLNAPPATRADTPVKITGTTDSAFTLTPIASATISGELAAGTSIFTTHSDGAGKFSQSQATGNMPLDIYLDVSATGYVTTQYYPSRPITHDVSFQVVLLTAMDEMTLASLGNVTFDNNHGAMLFTVDDCNGTPVSGATVTTAPAATVRYFAGVQPSLTATSTDMAGVVMVAGLPPGTVMVTAQVGGMIFKTHTFQAVGGTIIQTVLEP